MKTCPSIIYIVPDYNQKVLQTIYWEGKVDCYGKKRHEFVGDYGEKVDG